MNHQCLLCGSPVHDRGEHVFALDIRDPDGARIVLRWHPSCAQADALHLRMADALGLPDDQTEATTAAYVALWERALKRGTDHLVAAIDIRRDVPSMKVTMRGAGDAWGRLSRR